MKSRVEKQTGALGTADREAVLLSGLMCDASCLAEVSCLLNLLLMLSVSIRQRGSLSD